MVENNAEFAYELKELQDSLKTNCKNFYSRKNYAPYLKFQRMVYEQQSSFFWCPVPNAASGSWFLKLHILGGGSLDEVISSQLSPEDYALTSPYVDLDTQYLQSIAYDEPDLHTSFLILRHPYQRILATYLQNINGSLDDNFRETVCGRRRFDFAQESICDGFTFSQFVDHVIYYAQTFHVSEMDHNWAPISSICPVCHHEFRWDYILQFEELDQAQDYMIEQVCFLYFCFERFYSL